MITRWGRVGVSVSNADGQLKVVLELPEDCEAPVRLDVRGRYTRIVSGAEWVESAAPLSNGMRFALRRGERMELCLTAES